MRQRGWGYLTAQGAAAVAAIAAGPGSARPDDRDRAAFGARPLAQETSGGADVTAHSWSLYSGYTTGFGSDLREDGWRLRFVSGYSEYKYTSARWTGSTVIKVPFKGTFTFADALFGYQKGIGPLTLKLLAGLSGHNHAIDPFDVENAVQGLEWGAKGVVEAWINLGARAFVQLDAAYATPYGSYDGRLRLGYRTWPQISAGLEAGLTGNSGYGAGRAGAFLRYEAVAGEVSLSAGIAGDRSETTGAYGTVNFLYRF